MGALASACSRAAPPFGCGQLGSIAWLFAGPPHALASRSPELRAHGVSQAKVCVPSAWRGPMSNSWSVSRGQAGTSQ
eukprot:6239158-Alexandrium_andersonii.AAC.1